MDAPSDEEHFGSIPRRPCRACTDFKSWMKMQSSQKRKEKDDKAHGSEPQRAAAAVTAAVAGAAIPPAEPVACPLDKDELGRNTWSLLHTTAAYYPDRPSAVQQQEMQHFVSLFARFYPCDHCAKDFRKDVAEHPPAVESRATLARWFCDRHNTVNRKLGKDEFDCALIDQRWRDGWKDGSCG